MLKRKFPLVMQHDASDCAAAALAMICKYYKKEISIMKVREIIGTDSYGTSVYGIVEGAKKIGFDVKAIKINIKDINLDYTIPAVAQVVTSEGLNHFIVIYKRNKDSFVIGDPDKGLVTYTKKEFKKIFTGILVVLVPKNEFETNYIPGTSIWDIFKTIMLPQKRLLITVILSSLGLTILGILSSLFSKLIFDEIVPYELKKSLYIYMLVFTVISLMQTFLNFFRQYVLLFLSRKLDLPVLLGYYNHVLRLPFTFFSTRRVGDVLTRFQDAMTIKDIFSQVSISLILDLLLASLTGIAMIRLNWKLFLIIFTVVIINVITIYAFKGNYKNININQMEANGFMNSQLIESIKNIESIKAYGNENYQIEKLENNFVSVLKLNYKEGILSNLQGTISSGVSSIAGIILIGVGALAIIDGKLSIGDFIFFQTLSSYFTEPIQNLVSLQLTYQESQIAINRLSELMDLSIEDNDIESKLSKVDIRGDINFEDISFRYGSRPPIINKISFTLKKGSKIAIVGKSGAGKSTIAKLLMKFYETNNGNIIMNGYNIKDIKISTIRELIGYVPQNIELFTGTITDNLKIGNEHATFEEIIAATKLAGCYNFIQKLPNGFNSFVEENGSNFSGGEKQRIAIARAFLKPRQLYIFDESTSNLDSFSEKYIQRAMIEATNDITTIIIAHRISTIINSDYIIYLDDGNIIEEGTHKELLKLNGEYAKMIKLQYENSISNLKNNLYSELDEMSYE